MIIRNYLAGDAEHEAQIYNIAAAKLPGFVPVTLEEIGKGMTGRGFDPAARFYAEDNGQTVAFARFEPTGRVHYPWCVPGHEKMAHALFVSVWCALVERRVPRVYAACREDWADQIEFFVDHDFDRVRDIVNFTQSIGDLPTMFQRPGLDVTILQPSDVDAVANLVPGLLRLRGKELARYLLNNNAFPADAIYVLHRNHKVTGVGVLIDDMALANVNRLDPKARCFALAPSVRKGCPRKG